MKEKQSLPSAPILIETLRFVGYSFETAIADLIDNCIAAEAKRIDIVLIPSENPNLIIFDNGHGMSKKELEEALRYGARNPLETREENGDNTCETNFSSSSSFSPNLASSYEITSA